MALIISLLAHAAVFLSNSNLLIFPQSQKEQKLEVSYVKMAAPSNPRAKFPAADPDLMQKLPSRITIEKNLPPSMVNQNNAQEIFNKSLDSIRPDTPFLKPALMRPDTIAIKKKITLPPVDTNKINNPSYISYYQLIREKIRRAAYQNYIRTDTGEVYLSFVIAKDGTLKEVKLHDEKSSALEYLKQTSLKSIRDASPFPGFPKELEYPQLSFNVIISFAIE